MLLGIQDILNFWFSLAVILSRCKEDQKGESSLTSWLEGCYFVGGNDQR